MLSAFGPIFFGAHDHGRQLEWLGCCYDGVGAAYSRLNLTVRAAGEDDLPSVHTCVQWMSEYSGAVLTTDPGIASARTFHRTPGRVNFKDRATVPEPFITGTCRHTVRNQ